MRDDQPLQPVVLAHQWPGSERTRNGRHLLLDCRTQLPPLHERAARQVRHSVDGFFKCRFIRSCKIDERKSLNQRTGSDGARLVAIYFSTSGRKCHLCMNVGPDRCYLNCHLCAASSIPSIMSAGFGTLAARCGQSTFRPLDATSA